MDPQLACECYGGRVGRARPRLPPLNNDTRLVLRVCVAPSQSPWVAAGARHSTRSRPAAPRRGRRESGSLPAPVDRCPAVVMRTSAGRHLASEPKTNRPETNCTQRAEHPAGSALPLSYFSFFFFLDPPVVRCSSTRKAGGASSPSDATCCSSNMFGKT